MSPKRPPVPLGALRPKEWDPTDTQTLERQIELAHESAWRRESVDQLKAMAQELGGVRDTAREALASHEHKASKAELEKLAGKVDVVANSVFWLRLITFGVLVSFAVETALGLKGHR